MKDIILVKYETEPYCLYLNYTDYISYIDYIGKDGVMYKEKIRKNYCARLIVPFRLATFYLTTSLFFLFYFSISDAIGAPIIIDNTDSGFSRVGTWTTYSCVSGVCYGSNYLVTGAGTGTKKATWTFQISATGKYEVYAHWVSKFDRATNAPYTIKNNNTTLGTVLVDQRVNGGQFNLLGSYMLEAGTLQVVLTNNADGKVVADAIQIVLQVNQAPNGVIDTPGGNVTINVGETVSFTGTGNDPDNNLPLSYLWDFGDQAIADSTQEDPGVVQFNNVGTFTVTFTVTDSLGLPDPTPAQIVVDVVSPAVIIVDNTDPGFSKVGSWSTYLCGACYGANYFVTGAGTGSKKATWTFQIGAPGEYEISAQWASKFDRATNAPYTIKNNTTTLATVFVDQTVNGGQFNLLGTYTLQAGTLQVTLTNNANGKVVADAVQITASQVFGVISPSDLDLKTSQDILVEALVVGFPSGWGVEFTVKEKDSGNIIQQVEDYNRPFELQLSGLALQEYTVDALLIDQNGVFQSPFSDHVEFGVGDYYVGFGDSITRGSGDNIVSDNVSADGRNSGGGYEPILNNLLTTNKGYPHTVKNEGVSGNLSIDGLNRVSTMLSSHPDSQYLLILFGTNDAKSSPPVPSGMGLNPGDPGYNGTFKDNVQRIIDAVINEGKIPLLAKVPYALGSSSNGTPFPDPDTAPQNMLIQEYNVVIDELISANNIQVSPPDLFVAPDLYNHFRNNYLNNGGSEYADNLHPNGTGYQSIANLWEVSIFPSP